MKYFHKEKVTSTNEVAKELLINTPSLLDEGFVITADIQSIGKGTKGRVWYSDSTGGLYYSIAIKPSYFNFNKIEEYHIQIAEAVSKVTESLTNIRLTIKWPNDLYYLGKKLGGILMESSMNSGKNPSLNFLIIGIGLNINQESFPEHLENIATSLFIETKHKFNKAIFIDPLNNALFSLFS